MGAPDVIVIWKGVDPEQCDWTLALYAILHPSTGEILYIGKADGSTVRKRWMADDKHDHLGHTLDVSLNVYAKLGLERRTEALELFESRLRGDALKAA